MTQRPPANAATALATAVVDELVRGGVRHLVLSPGSRSAPLGFAAFAAAAAGRIGLHTRIDERTAGFLALGIAAGVALAAALPELHHACGLATVQLLTDDVVTEPMLPVDGMLAVTRPEVDEAAVARLTPDADRVLHWRRRLEAQGEDRAS